MVKVQATVAALAGSALLVTASALLARSYGEWGNVVDAETLPGSSSELNTPQNDGCPIISPYDESLYIASNRTGSQGLDIYRAPRSGDGWGTPVRLGPEVNTAADEFCPSPARGNRLFFVRRSSATNTDIYVVKNGPNGLGTAERLGSNVNSSAEEWSPSYFEVGGHEYLYFSSTREGRQRIYFSVDWGPAQLAAGGVNSSDADARPNVRHDGLEIVWDSTRYGSLGATDIWTASRSSIDEPWGTAVHLPPGINSPAGESRASMSWDGRELVFGSGRTGGGDVYHATRAPEHGRWSGAGARDCNGRGH